MATPSRPVLRRRGRQVRQKREMGSGRQARQHGPHRRRCGVELVRRGCSAARGWRAASSPPPSACGIGHGIRSDGCAVR
jgi:hypothetical protein